MLSALSHAPTLSFLSSAAKPGPCRPTMASSSLVRIAVFGDVEEGSSSTSARMLSIVGGRPFSCWGQQIFRNRLLSLSFGVQDMDGSAKRIYEAALGTPEDHLAILLAHNGPTGLNICGKDWVFGGCDHGDPDLTSHLHLKETTTFSIPIVVFDHRHKELAHGNGLGKMTVVGTDNIIYLIGAIVPRVKRQQTAYRRSVDNETSLLASNSDGTKRAFSLVEILSGRVEMRDIRRVVHTT